MIGPGRENRWFIAFFEAPQRVCGCSHLRTIRLCFVILSRAWWFFAWGEIYALFGDCAADPLRPGNSRPQYGAALYRQGMAVLAIPLGTCAGWARKWKIVCMIADALDQWPHCWSWWAIPRPLGTATDGVGSEHSLQGQDFGEGVCHLASIVTIPISGPPHLTH